VVAEANEQSHLFQAVHEQDIVKAATAKGVDIDTTMIKIKAPIKALGEHAISLIGCGKEEMFTILVVKK
jgi:ribosomal protein L9